MRWHGLAIVVAGGLGTMVVGFSAVSISDRALAQAAVPVAQPSAPVEEIRPAPGKPAVAADPAVARREDAARKAAADAAAARKLGRDDDIVGDIRPHPLAAAYPDQNVVVCEAGCPRGRNSIVYMAPRRPSGFLQVSTLTTSSNVTPASTGMAAAEPAQASTALECVAGCYASRSSPSSSRRQEGAPSGRFQGTWLTAPEPQQATPAPRPRTSRASRSRKTHSSEWFTTRF